MNFIKSQKKKLIALVTFLIITFPFTVIVPVGKVVAWLNNTYLYPLPESNYAPFVGRQVLMYDGSRVEGKRFYVITMTNDGPQEEAVVPKDLVPGCVYENEIELGSCVNLINSEEEKKSPLLFGSSDTYPEAGTGVSYFKKIDNERTIIFSYDKKIEIGFCPESSLDILFACFQYERQRLSITHGNSFKTLLNFYDGVAAYSLAMIHRGRGFGFNNISVPNKDEIVITFADSSGAQKMMDYVDMGTSVAYGKGGLGVGKDYLLNIKTGEFALISAHISELAKPVYIK